jgi:Regulator of ribonuclease activity B
MTWDDAQQIEVKRSAGVDLSRPVPVSHHLYFFMESRALAGSEFLRREGFSVAAEYRPDHDPPEWEIVAKRDEVVTLACISSLRSLMESLAEPLDEHDGWSIVR